MKKVKQQPSIQGKDEAGTSVGQGQSRSSSKAVRRPVADQQQWQQQQQQQQQQWQKKQQEQQEGAIKEILKVDVLLRYRFLS
eukprot:1161647-Pelagomonas_calceolata.AAC.6